eukprot:CAMPEP_0204642908 /NCGR_PEP_ID=MMETSP0718-20130828/244_1 /ASSEMBLY_ACC=CAM_ASM_000674 /TAXON_ID=230516 /ORGANISM="Chaetoceros curvisetus" /LENGTH=323 /DNA_ID=CAMNT_0051663843 /DNA_START=367 /DNA_END=1338 /DNA_ORIENTATION=-
MASISQRYNVGHASFFPLTLMKILDNENISNIISWLSHGKGFMIHDKYRFDSEVLPVFFQGVKFTSFVRRMKRWGFSEQRVSRLEDTPNKNNRQHKMCLNKYAYVFFHPQFIRGKIGKCLEMKNLDTNNVPQTDAGVTRNEKVINKKRRAIKTNLIGSELPFQNQLQEDCPTQHPIARLGNVGQVCFPPSTTTLIGNNHRHSFVANPNNTDLLSIFTSSLSTENGDEPHPPVREVMHPANNAFSSTTRSGILPHYCPQSSEEHQRISSRSLMHYKALYEMNVKRQADLTRQEIQLSRLVLRNEIMMSSMDTPSLDHARFQSRP